MIALARWYILGYVTGSSIESTQKIQVLENKLRLFRSHAELMRADFNTTLVDKFDKITVAVLIDEGSCRWEIFIYIWNKKCMKK